MVKVGREMMSIRLFPPNGFILWVDFFKEECLMKKFLSIFMSLLLLICEVSTVPVLAVDNKVPDGYIGVYNIEDLYNIRFGLEKKYILMADIDMTDYVAEGGMFNSGIGWKPIGDNSSFFSGEFNGNYHTISGLVTSDNSQNYIGLFGKISGIVYDLTLSNFLINSSADYIGTLAGMCVNSQIHNISIKSLTINSSSLNVGGLFGSSVDSIVTNVSSSGEINIISDRQVVGSEEFSIGGIIGISQNSEIKKLSNATNINIDIDVQPYIYERFCSTTISCGGICGTETSPNITIIDCKNNGLILSDLHQSTSYYWSNGNKAFTNNISYISGIVGKSYGDITSCFNAGRIGSSSSGSYYATNETAGIVAKSYANISNSYNTGSIGSVQGVACGIATEGTVRKCINMGKITSGNHCSSITDGNIEQSYYLFGTASAGKYGVADTIDTAISLSETQINEQFFYHYLDFENIWFIDDEINHPQLVSNPESEHIHSYVAEIIESTCTEQGFTTYTCSRCKDSYIADYTPAKGHTEGEWKVTKQPTLTEEGEKTLYCKECGQVIKTEAIPKLTHGQVHSISVNDISLNYKSSKTLVPTVEVDEGVNYTVTYSSSNPKVATVDENGKVYGAKKGSTEITVTVTDEYGNTVSDTCKVNVTYAWWQWIIVIVLFGWIWY